MSIILDLPADLEQKLAAEASRHGIPLSDYLLRFLSNGGQTSSNIYTGAQLVAYWQNAGLIGSRADISDSQQHARQLRAEAERRQRS